MVKLMGMVTVAMLVPLVGWLLLPALAVMLPVVAVMVPIAAIVLVVKRSPALATAGGEEVVAMADAPVATLGVSDISSATRAKEPPPAVEAPPVRRAACASAQPAAHGLGEVAVAAPWQGG